MSSAIKILVGLVVLAGAGWAVWWSGWLRTPMAAPAPVAEVATTTAPAPEPTQNMNGMSDAKDASDEALAKDSAAVGTQMQGLSSDSAQVDSSFNDKQTPQGY